MFRIRITNEKHKALLAIVLGLPIFVLGLRYLPMIYEEYSAYSAMIAKGVEAKAHISYGDTLPGTIKGSVDHRIDFSWRDVAGKDRAVKSLSVSEDVWKRIASGKTLIAHEIPIKYLESDQTPRAILVWDADAGLRRILWEVMGTVIAILLGGAATVKALGFFLRLRKQPGGLANSGAPL